MSGRRWSQLGRRSGLGLPEVDLLERDLGREAALVALLAELRDLAVEADAVADAGRVSRAVVVGVVPAHLGVVEREALAGAREALVVGLGDGDGDVAAPAVVALGGRVGALGLGERLGL